VDDQEVVTWGFRTVLAQHAWVEQCVRATDASVALALAQRQMPHVALVDLFLADTSGAELCVQLRRTVPPLQVLLMSSGDSMSARTVHAAGACGFVSKRWSADQLVAAVHLAGCGVGLTTAGDPDAALTPREEQVVAVMARGATNEEIARELYLSVYTVKQHARAAFRKLHARNRTDAVQRAQRSGLIG
jgi:two-component system response regulator DesR